MYQIGDHVFYENTGVCRITDISSQRVPGSTEDRMYYTLTTCFQPCVIRTPVDNPKVMMRPIITKDEAERLIDSLSSMQPELCEGKAGNQLAQQYRESIKAGSCADLLLLSKSLHTKKAEQEEQKRKHSAVDERYMRRAEELLFGELSLALDIEVDEVPAYIASRVALSVSN